MRGMGRKQTDEVGVYTEFASRLKAAVEKAKLSGNQNQIGGQFGITGAFYGQMLKGRKLPGMDTAIDMAIRLNVSIEWLLTGRGQMEFLGWSDPIEREFLLLLRELPSEFREEFLRLLQASARLQEPMRKDPELLLLPRG